MMVAFNSIKAGDVLYDCHKQKMGNTTMTRMATFSVKVIEIDAAKRKALCSWNGNKPNWYSERDIKALRRTPKKAKPTIFDMARRVDREVTP
jgi:hypothetical protein